MVTSHIHLATDRSLASIWYAHGQPQVRRWPPAGPTRPEYGHGRACTGLTRTQLALTGWGAELAGWLRLHSTRGSGLRCSANRSTVDCTAHRWRPKADEARLQRRRIREDSKGPPRSSDPRRPKARRPRSSGRVGKNEHGVMSVNTRSVAALHAWIPGATRLQTRYPCRPRLPKGKGCPRIHGASGIFRIAPWILGMWIHPFPLIGRQN